MIRKIPDDPGDDAPTPQPRRGRRRMPASAAAPVAVDPAADEQGSSEAEPAEAGAAETGAAEVVPAEAVSAESGPAESGASTDLSLEHRAEALLFATGQPLSVRRLASLLGEDGEAVKVALAALQESWGQRAGAIDLVEIAGGWRFMTRPVFADVVGALTKRRGPERLSPAALETLAVVAYRQPVGRADIETVRGVRCGPLLRVLLDRDLVRIAGRSEEPGHPLLYGTTKRFLDHFGLKSLKHLPDVKDVLAAT